MKLKSELNLQLQSRAPGISPQFFSDSDVKILSMGTGKGAVSFQSVMKDRPLAASPSDCTERFHIRVFVPAQSEPSWQDHSDNYFDSSCLLEIEVLGDGVLDNAGCGSVQEKIKCFTSSDTLPEFVLIQVTKNESKMAYQLADAYRRKGCYVILTGLAVSNMPEKAQNHADCIFVGAAKRNLKQFIDDYRNNDQRRFYYAPWKQVEAKEEKINNAAETDGVICNH